MRLRWSVLAVLLCWNCLAGSAMASDLGEIEAALQHGQYDRAAELAEKLADSSPEAAVLAARAHLARGRSERAINLLTKTTRTEGRFRALALLGMAHAQRGEQAAAERAFQALVEAFNAGDIKSDDGDGLFAVAIATQGLGAYRDANQTFAEATRASPEDVEIELAWAELFFDKYDTENAGKSLSKVLNVRPSEARALERMARIRLGQGSDFQVVDELLSRALNENPNLTAAYVTRAGMKLRDMELSAADKELDRALDVNPHDLEALSVRAAVRFLADDKPGFDKAVRAVLSEHPRYSRLYSILGTYAEWEHRYEDLVKLADAALKLDPDDAYAHAMRGLNLLRIGEEKEGIASLERAWSRDRYNVLVFNTLNLYDDVISKEYQTNDAGPFRLRTHRDEKALLEAYALPLLRRAYASMQKRYDMTPKGPLSIELYANPEHFSVRTSGLPHLGVQGVCFGKVLTALSPRGGEFNWGQILWHELSHVFHVQRSNSHVPRWFTEGLAEYETIIERPEWKREDDRALWDALLAGKLPTVAGFNRAFTHAQNPEQLMVAYYASSQIVGYIVQRYGFKVVPQLLSAWGEGLGTEQVLTRVLKTNATTLDADFRQALSARLSAKYKSDYRVDIQDYADLEARRLAASRPDASAADRAALALSLARAGHKDARTTAESVLREAPNQPEALFALAHLSLVSSDAQGAIKPLQTLVQTGHDGYQIRLLLARCWLKQSSLERARAELEAAIAIDAERQEAHDVMVKILDETKDGPRLRQALDAVVRGDQHARAPLERLLKLLEADGDSKTMLARAESGLYLDPESALLHRVLSEALRREGRATEALAEADWAMKLSQDDPERARAELVRSRALTDLKRPDDAQAARKRALTLDPSLEKQAVPPVSR